jgi:AraC family transcriptional regulator
MANTETTNYILHAKSNQFYWEGNGQLSIKTFTNGKAYYKTNRGFFAVEENRYLILNQGPYTLSIEEKEEVESFCLFFKDGFAEEVRRSLQEPLDDLLTDPCNEAGSIEFIEKTHPVGRGLALQLNIAQERMKSGCSSEEDVYHSIMEILLRGHSNQVSEIESLQAVRTSTREELFRRISIAHEYIRAYYDQPITLKDIASAACLSQNHLLRNYSRIYGRTPHQHISGFRIRKAKQLLTESLLSMTEITFRLGFNNPVSFSKMFKQHTGISPLQFRKKVIMDKN